MRRLTLLLVAMAVMLTSMIGWASPAAAEETSCTGTLGAVTVDNLRVPDGSTCTLNGTQAQGTIYVGTGASLTAVGVRVNGNIQAEGARSVVVRGASFVGGNIQIKQGVSARIDRTTINGSLLFDENRGSLRATANVIGSDLQAFKNTGGLLLSNNRIAQNMQCKENDPAPTGSGNIAGSKQDQCAGL